MTATRTIFCATVACFRDFENQGLRDAIFMVH